MSDQMTHPPASSSRGQFPADAWLKALTSPGFLACVIILVTVTLGFQKMVKWTGTRFVLKPAPLRKELANFDAKLLRPFHLGEPRVIEPNVLQALGTDKYIEWPLADPYDQEGNLRKETAEDGWAKVNWPRWLHLFVTYYTGARDPVPHVPEACYQGSGYEQTLEGSNRFKKDDTLEVKINGQSVTIPLRVLAFSRRGELSDRRRLVMYTFHCNGAFRRGREGVLKATKESEYMYYSKIEVAVDLDTGYRDEIDAIQAAKRLLARAAVVLVNEHFPDWDALRDATDGEAGESEAL